MLDWSRAAHRRPNHVSRATGLAYVRARGLDRDRQVVSAAVVPPFRAGLAACNIVVPHSAEFGVDVGEDQLGLVSHFRSATCTRLQSLRGRAARIEPTSTLDIR